MNSLKKVQDNIPLIFFFTTLFIVFHQDSSGQFNEDFSDNNLHTNPKWSGDIDKFIIEDCKLRSNSLIPSDGDGYEDFLILKYQMDKLGYVLNGYIYTLSGFQVHHPFNNLLISREGNLKWNGTDSNGIKLPVGNYILLIEAFNETGEIIKKKIAFGITGIF